MFSFLKKVKQGLDSFYLFIGNELEVFIPQKYFDKGIAIFEGTHIKTIGIFIVRYNNELYKMTMPIDMQMEFSEFENLKSYKLHPKIPAIAYKKFILKTNDKFIMQTNYRAKIQTTINLLNYVFNGYLENDVAYDDVFSIIVDGFAAAGKGLPATPTIFSAVISTLYRSRSDNNIPFRQVYNKNNPYAYKNVNILRVPELTSVFNSMIGENLNYQLTNAVLRSKKSIKEAENPIEELISRQWGDTL